MASAARTPAPDGQAVARPEPTISRAALNAARDVAGALQMLTRELEDILMRDTKPLTLDARDRVNLRRAIEALHVMRADHAHHLHVYSQQAGELVDLRIRLHTAQQGMRDLLGAIE